MTGSVGSDLQPAASVKTKVACPAVKAVTKPPFVTLATSGLFEAHVPPEFGDKLVVSPIHNSSSPVIDTAGP
jgi:hypothetical protein